MTYEEALSFIHQTDWKGSRLGLDRMRELMGLLGNPQERLRFIHVAGTNGKGSTCAMLASVLTAAGYRTGMYISPHLVRVNERISVNGADISDGDLIAAAEQVRDAAGNMADQPTEFELITAMALCHFARQRCDLVVLEVGLGGRLDATNIIPPPEAAVITNIGLEHTEILGDTPEKIAGEKAGIIKASSNVVLYSQTPEVEQVVRAICREHGCPLSTADPAHLSRRRETLAGQRFCWRGTQYAIPLLGAHQTRNAGVVLETVQALRHRGWKIREEAVSAGLGRVRWPARMEVLCKSPVFLLDGGHNPQCAQAAAGCLGSLLPGQKVVFLMGVLADKDYPAVIDRLMPFAQEFVCLTPESERALPAGALAEYLTRRGANASPYDGIEDGIAAALSAAGERGAVVALGSLYLAGFVREAFHGAYRSWLRKEKIRARDALGRETRERLSRRIAARIAASGVFQTARTILIYRAVPGEVQLNALETAPQSQNKRIAFPRCVSDTEMIALLPHDPTAWAAGYRGIQEPILERSEQIAPDDIDLVICPCTVFDEDCHRMGMGAGFYDRYLKKCTHAQTIAVAFECQKSPKVPTAPWDCSIEYVFTESAVYHTKNYTQARDMLLQN